MTQLPTEEVPAVDADLVWDPAERRLLRAFRDNPPQIKILVLQMAESHAPRVRKLSASAPSEDLAAIGLTPPLSTR